MKKSLALFITLIMLILPLTLCFTSCESEDTNKAKEYIISFLTEVREGDFDSAKEHLHPSFDDDIEVFFNEVEDVFGVDFQEGITILRYTNTYTSLYNSEYDGFGYELTMEIEVSGYTLQITVLVVENDIGYGIYYIEIDD